MAVWRDTRKSQPKEGERVLVWDGEDITIAQLAREDNYVYWLGDHLTFLTCKWGQTYYWRPLPKPPRGIPAPNACYQGKQAKEKKMKCDRSEMLHDIPECDAFLSALDKHRMSYTVLEEARKRLYAALGVYFQRRNPDADVTEIVAQAFRIIEKSGG